MYREIFLITLILLIIFFFTDVRFLSLRIETRDIYFFSCFIIISFSPLFSLFTFFSLLFLFSCLLQHSHRTLFFVIHLFFCCLILSFFLFYYDHFPISSFLLPCHFSFLTSHFLFSFVISHSFYHFPHLSLTSFSYLL